MTANLPPWVDCPACDVFQDAAGEIRYGPFPPELWERSRQLLSRVLADAAPRLEAIPQLLRLRTGDRFQAEAVALAELAGVRWQELMLASISYDLTLGLLGCSTALLATPEGPVMARNMDWWPEQELARASCLVRHWQGERLLLANAGWPGAIGAVTGLSGRGFALALNAVLCDEPFCRTGYPVMLHLRCVLEDATDFDAALEMLRRTRLTSPGLISLIGSRNDQRVVIERTPTRHALRWAEGDEPLVATNDYHLLGQAETSDVESPLELTCSRYAHLLTSLASAPPSAAAADEWLLYLLTDPRVIQGITAQHVIVRPRSRQIRLLAPRRLVGEPVAG